MFGKNDSPHLLSLLHCEFSMQITESSDYVFNQWSLKVAFGFWSDPQNTYIIFKKQAHITYEAKPRGLHFVRLELLLQL